MNRIPRVSEEPGRDTTVKSQAEDDINNIDDSIYNVLEKITFRNHEGNMLVTYRIKPRLINHPYNQQFIEELLENGYDIRLCENGVYRIMYTVVFTEEEKAKKLNEEHEFKRSTQKCIKTSIAIIVVIIAILLSFIHCGH
jgi:hypothetical protein